MKHGSPLNAGPQVGGFQCSRTRQLSMLYSKYHCFSRMLSMLPWMRDDVFRDTRFLFSSEIVSFLDTFWAQMAPGRRFGASTVPLATLSGLEGSLFRHRKLLEDPFGFPQGPNRSPKGPFQTDKSPRGGEGETPQASWDPPRDHYIRGN